MIDYKIVIYWNKYEYNLKWDNCVRYFGSVYEMYCIFCEFLVCFKCIEYENHMLVDI